MKYRLVVTEDAELDIEDAMDWYENKQEGLGRKYLNSITTQPPSVKPLWVI